MAATDTIRSAAASGRISMPQGDTLGLTILFLITVLIPGYGHLGGFVLSPLRIFLLVSIVPYAVQIISGKMGRFTKVDLFFLLHGAWIIVALVAVHGTTRIPFAVITAVETVGGYFVGRALVRSAEEYRRLFKITLVAILILLPFAILENVTGKMVLPDLFSSIMVTPVRGDSAYGRMGLERAFVVFAHPIHWGLFCSLMLANWVMMVRNNKPMIPVVFVFTLYVTMLSLSSAPLLACMLQIILLAWHWISKGRWKLFMILAALAYVAVDMSSNRTPVTIIISSLTFNPMSGYIRLAIFDFGWAAVERSPMFGIGFNEWPRPFWLTNSVDNFWLLTAMRFGLVGAGFLVLAILAHFWLLSRAAVGSADARALRVGHALALVGITFTLATVHIWSALAVFVMFYIGAGAWIYAYDQSGESGGEPAEAEDPRALRYTRFATAPGRRRAEGPSPRAPLAGPRPLGGA